MKSVNATSTATTQRWTMEMRLAPIENMMMPTNVTLPGVKEPIFVTKFGLQSNNVQLDRDTLLHLGDVVAAPHLFFFYGAEEMTDKLLAVDPAKVMVFGSLVSGPGVEDGDSPAYVLVKLADADAKEPLCGASNRVQYTTEAAKRRFRKTWASIAKVEDDMVTVVEMSVMLKAFQKGGELQKGSASTGVSSR